MMWAGGKRPLERGARGAALMELPVWVDAMVEAVEGEPSEVEGAGELPRRHRPWPVLYLIG